MDASTRAKSLASPSPRSRPRRLPAALLLAGGAVLAAVACDSNLACPQGYSSLASFTVAFSAVDAGAACIINKMTDGGPADASLIGNPSSALMQLCGATTDAGGLSVSYSLRGSGTHTSDLDGGVFSQSSTGSGQTGSACLCALDLNETITGSLRTADGGPFGLEADGGFTPVVSISGSVVEAISATAGTTGCACTLPCAAGFSFKSQ
jgi:hypothetical protein